MNVVDYVDKYLNEYPQDELIFQEISQRADLSPAEEKIFWEAIEHYCTAIVEFELDSRVALIKYELDSDTAIVEFESESLPEKLDGVKNADCD